MTRRRRARSSASGCAPPSGERPGQVTVRSGEVRLQVSVTDEQLQMSIRDNGKGFDDGPKGISANGLANMQHRMNDIGGQCAIGSKPGAGTTVTVSLPLARAKKKA